MAEEKTSIFRKKTLEAVQSPEVLDDYLRVTSPGVWIFLAAVICLLVGVILWGVFGTIESKADVVLVAENGTAVCVVPYKESEAVMEAGTVLVGEETYVLNKNGATQGVLDDSTDPRILIEGNLSEGDYVVVIPLAEMPAETGVRSASVVTETIKPISLLLQ